MRKLLLLLTFIIPMLANAMKIETDEIDEFTGQRTVITSWVKINYDQNHIRFRLQNGICYLDWKMLYNGPIVIKEGDKIMFKGMDGDIASFESVTTEFGAKGAGATGLGGSAAWGIFARYTGPIEWFDTHTAKLVRVYSTDVYIDRKVKENEGRQISALYKLFQSTIDGNPKTDMQSYHITYVKKRAKSNKWDVAKEEDLKFITEAELSEIMNKWKSQTSETTHFDCRVKKIK